MKKNILVLLTAFISFSVLGNITLPKIFNDNMVLQRNKPIAVWGWGDANEKVIVQLKNQSKTTKADRSGKWLVTLSAEPAGGPVQLIVKGKNTIILKNILIGEVWVCSGQSNMEFTLRGADNAQQEIQHADYPKIRHFLVPKSVSSEPENDIKGGEWKVCSPENAGDFTAVGYFFARDLLKSLDIPIGLIHTSWGGTHSETWTSRKAFEQSDEFRAMIATMPSVDLDAMAKHRREQQLQNLKQMNITLPAKEVDLWKDASFNDGTWKEMTLPGLWEQQGLDGVDGVVWFRKGVIIGKEDVGKKATLELGMIDDSDETFINGTQVGSTKGRYNERRKYTIPEGVLKEGKNIIAVRVEDTGGGGGIYGDDQEMKITTNSGAISPLAGKWTFSVEELSVAATQIGPNTYPTLLFNAMIHPLLKVGIRGVIWYQGESNAGRAHQYRKAFPMLIRDWREHWHQGEFPFYFVQLASFNADHGTSEKGSAWAELREAQSMTLSLPNTGMAVTTDIGEADDIHPRNKQDVGKRLAAIALHETYSQDIVYSGPTYDTLRIESNRIILTFNHVGSGLVAKDKYGYLKGFEVAGADHKFHYAVARVNGNDVIVSAELVSNPIAVRYAWADNPQDANLFNKEGFPAAPFRTDQWEGITDNATFHIED